MLTFILFVLGAVFGGAMAEEEGATFGAILGLLLGFVLGLKRRVDQLSEGEKQRAETVEALRKEVWRLQGELRAAAPPVTENVPLPEPVPENAAEAAEPPTPTPTPTPAPTPAPAPEQPPVPDPFADAVAFLRSLVFGGNTVVRVGILVLLVGVTLLLKYAADQGLFSIELRMGFAALIGMALVFVGLRVRHDRPGFARTLQGGGVAALYLVVFFSYRTYGLLPSGLAFGLLAGIAAASAALAVLQDAMALVVIGQLGGFLAPILASSGSGNHVALFSYYLVLNLAIFAIAWVRAWRPLNLLGFLCTFAIGTTWGVLRYRPEDLATTEPFLIAFFLLYVAIPVLFALRHDVRGWIDGTLVFGAPLAFLGLQLSLVREVPFAMAYTSLALGVLYIGLARLLQRRAPDALRAMVEAFLALGVGFGTLAIPYGLDNAGLTSAAWALEGAGLYWVGVRQARVLPRIAAVVLQGMAGIAFLVHAFNGYPHGALPIVNTRCLAATLLALASLFIARHAHKHRASLPGWEADVLQGLVGWGLVFLVPAYLEEVDRHVSAEWTPGLQVACVALIAIALELAARRLEWRPARYPGALLVLLLLPLALIWDDDLDSHLLSHGGWVGWPLYFAYIGLCLSRFVPDAPRFLRYLHPIALWGVTGFFALLLYRATLAPFGLPEGWAVAAAGIAPVVALALLQIGALEPRFPLRDALALYLGLGAFGLAGAFGLYSLAVNLSADGPSEPLPYLPIVNPIDLVQLLGFAAVLTWFRRERGRAPERLGADWHARLSALPALLALFMFVWWNALLARSVHHYAHVRWDADDLWRSSPLQVALSISWTLIGLCVTVLATRLGRRGLWICGAALLGVVVVKLFTVDLARLSTLAKIGTFLIVGLLLLLVGYLSPVPGGTNDKLSEAPR